MRKTFISLFMVIAATLLLLSSCTENDPIRAIPRSASAVLSIDVGQAGGVGNRAVFKALLKLTDADDCGIDFSRPVYLFETAEGNFGLCAAVSNENDLRDFLNAQHEKGLCQAVSAQSGCHFTVVGGSWAAGFSADAVVLLGPIAPSAAQIVYGRIARWLSQDEKQSITASPLYAKLTEIEAPVRLVAQASALPQLLAAPLTLGTPRDADMQQVLLSAAIEPKDSCLLMDGKVFSLNQRLQNDIAMNREQLRKIDGRFVENIPTNALISLLLSGKGEQLVPVMQQNSAFQALLAGATLDDEASQTIKKIDGDLLVNVLNFGSESADLSLKAVLEGGEIYDFSTLKTLPTAAISAYKLPASARQQLENARLAMVLKPAQFSLQTSNSMASVIDLLAKKFPVIVYTTAE